MKTKMTITVDSKVKNQFQEIAKRMWSNVSVLTNMFFVSVINTWSVNYYDKINDLWFDLYREFLIASDEDKKDDFSLKFDKKSDVKNFSKKLEENLWN